MSVRLATGPVSWGVDFADGPDNPPWPDVLDAIARSGFRWTELGPIGYLPEEPETLRAELAARELGVASSFVFQPLHDAPRLPDVLAVTRRTCRAIAATGGHHLVIIDLVSPERIATAGRRRAARRLALGDWLTLVDGARAVARVAADEFGLRPVFHPHAGTYVEFAEEIDDLLDALAPDVLGLCVDTGHAAYAGLDPVALYERHAGRVSYLHLKDVDGDVHRRVPEERLDFWAAIGAGVFCPLGAGVVDFPALAHALERHGFDGWATVEQDRDPTAGGDPLGDVIASREFLEQAGISPAPDATEASNR